MDISESDERKLLLQRIAALKQEHRDLDDTIARLSTSLPYDELLLRRLKKRKLALRDQIAKLEAMLWPDIIA